jgi:hypothetical protein
MPLRSWGLQQGTKKLRQHRPRRSSSKIVCRCRSDLLTPIETATAVSTKLLDADAKPPLGGRWQRDFRMPQTASLRVPSPTRVRLGNRRQLLPTHPVRVPRDPRRSRRQTRLQSPLAANSSDTGRQLMLAFPLFGFLELLFSRLQSIVPKRFLALHGFALAKPLAWLPENRCRRLREFLRSVYRRRA